MNLFNIQEVINNTFKSIRKHFLKTLIILLLVPPIFINLSNIVYIADIPTSQQAWDEVIKLDESWLTNENWLDGFYCETEDTNSCRSRNLEDSYNQWLLHVYNDKRAIGNPGLVLRAREDLKRLQLIYAINDSEKGRVSVNSNLCSTVSGCQDQYLLGLIIEANRTEDPAKIINILARANSLIELRLIGEGNREIGSVRPQSNVSTLASLAINAMLRDIRKASLRTPGGDFNFKIQDRLQEQRGGIDNDFVDGFDSNN